MSMIIAGRALSSNAAQGADVARRGSLSKLSTGHRVSSGHSGQIASEKLRLLHDAFERTVRSASRPAVVFSDSPERTAAGRLVAV